MVLVTCLTPLASEPVSAGSYGYYPARYYGGYRSDGHNFNRRRFARYNKFYRYRLRNYGKYYNHHPEYGNSYLGDTYNKTLQNDNLDTREDTREIADSLDTLGWLQLSNGEYTKARDTFSSLARKESNDGSFRIGYALAAASIGDLHKGVWAMRSALRIDPDSLNHFMTDGYLQGIVLDLIYRYEDEDHHTLATTARKFMIASLYYMLGDDESAGNILPVNDKDSSTRNLLRLIEQTRHNP